MSISHGVVILASEPDAMLNHVDINIKLRFLIKSRYHMVPSPSTTVLGQYTSRNCKSCYEIIALVEKIVKFRNFVVQSYVITMEDGLGLNV